MKTNRPPSMKTFLIIWFGQVISMLGSGLTGFALGVWVYQQTGSVTRFALIAFFTSLPGLIVSPFAGALVDRWDRRWTMILSDCGAGFATLGIVILLWTDSLELWHIYLLMGMGSIFNSFQWPAFTASTTLLVPKARFGQAAGMTQMGTALAQVVSPILGGLLLVSIGLWGVILIDFGTFLFATATLLVIHVPRPEASAEGAQAKSSLWREAAYGWTYLRQRDGLMGLLWLFAATNFAMGMLQALLPPLVLSFTTAPVLGSVLSVAGVGMVVGTVVMSLWGGPARRVYGIFGALMVQGVILFLGGLQPNAWLIGSAAFVFLFVHPVVMGCSQAIWQSKVAPDIQGRVFAVRRMVAMSALPVAYLLAGPLADRVFEPALAPGGALAATVGAVIGVGDGRGVGFLFMLLGMFVLIALVVGFAYPRLRRVEEELPDAIPDEEELDQTATLEMPAAETAPELVGE